MQRLLLGENPFLKEKENKEEDVLKGLIEDVRALYKEIAPAKETYIEKLKKKNSSSSSPSTSKTSSTSISSISSPSSPSSRATSGVSSAAPTKSKKKQL